MKRFIHTALSPNAQADDVVRACEVLLQPWMWKRGSAVDEIEKRFSKMFDAQAISMSSGRSCLSAILSTLDLASTDEVLLQSFTCVAVPGPVLWNCSKPVYVDCTADGLTMDPEDLERKLTPHSKVLIIQHTFGRAADLVRLLEIAKRHNLFVIEDCAHSLGGMSAGRLLGTFGDAAFFSFGRDKVISSIFGGMVVVKDTERALRLRRIEAAKIAAPSSWIMQQLVHPIVMSTAKSVYGVFGLGKVIVGISKRFRITSKAVLPIEKRGGMPPFIDWKMPNALAVLALHQLEKLKTFNAHREDIASMYLEALSGSSGLTCEAGENGRVWLRFSVFATKRDEILKKAREQGISLGDWYDVPIAPPGVDAKMIAYRNGSCPNAERHAREVFNLPTHIGIGRGEAQRIIALIKSICH